MMKGLALMIFLLIATQMECFADDHKSNSHTTIIINGKIASDTPAPQKNITITCRKKEGCNNNSVLVNITGNTTIDNDISNITNSVIMTSK